MRGSFQLKTLKDIVRNMKVGMSGFVLVNPASTDESGVSFLTEEYFFFSTGLILFETKKQAALYKKLVNAPFLMVLGIERIGNGFTEKDFSIDLSAGDQEVGFVLSYPKKDDLELYLSNGKFVSIMNPSLEEVDLTIDQYLKRLSMEIAEENAEDFDEREYDFNLIKDDISKIKIIGINSLEYALKVSISQNNFKLTSLVKREMEKRKKKK